MSKLLLVFEPVRHINKVIAAAKRGGFTVIVFHTSALRLDGIYALNPEDIAERYQFESWSDHDSIFTRIVEICADRDVAGTYAAHEPLLALEARVQEHFGLPTKTGAFINRYLDKVNVRRDLQRHGLTKLRVVSADEMRTTQTWPLPDRALYFKPIRGSASAYVRRCTSVTEARDAVAYWERNGQTCGELLRHYLTNGNGYFFEEEASGELMSLEGYVDRGTYHALGLTSRTVLERDVTVEMGATFPYHHPLYEAIVTKVDAIHAALNVRHGATHAELIVSPGGEIELVELNLRFAGADVLLLVDTAYDAPTADVLVGLAVGAAPGAVLPRTPKRYASVQYVLPPQGLTTFESIDLDNPDILCSDVLTPIGTAFPERVSQTDILAGFITCSDTYESALRRALDIRRTVRVNGAPIDVDPNNVVISR